MYAFYFFAVLWFKKSNECNNWSNKGEPENKPYSQKCSTVQHENPWTTQDNTQRHIGQLVSKMLILLRHGASEWTAEPDFHSSSSVTTTPSTLFCTHTITQSESDSQQALINRFTGWKDVSLSTHGVKTAVEAARRIQAGSHPSHMRPHWCIDSLTHSSRCPMCSTDWCNATDGLTIDVIHTSCLRRAVHTSWIIQEELDVCWIPCHQVWKTHLSLSLTHTHARNTYAGI